jgi:hypothetical protein
VTPLIGALVELLRAGVVHNAIRPTNLFWRVGASTPPQLGECLSAPAGLGQPVLFETVERGMAMPLGRGMGVHTDDCYAFGVMLAMLVLGRNPMQGMEDAAILQAKIDKGSFTALIGNHRLSSTHIELLRGLLADDARQRWSAADLEQWLNGRRLTPKNTDSGRRAVRHLEFNGKDYWQTRPLALALSSNAAEAAKIIENGVLEKWLRRAMNDEDRALNLEEAHGSLRQSGKSANYEDQLVARVCIALDPGAPIRYRGLAVMPAGIAALLVDAALTDAHTQILKEIIASRLVTLWIDMQGETKGDLVALGQQFEKAADMIEKTALGNGFERVLYELNTILPCLSPILRGQYVTSPKALLPALETATNRPREPMDRHIAAYLVVRDRRSEKLFSAISAPEGSIKRGVALLTLFADMQSRHGPDSLPHMAQWLEPLAEPAARRFFNRTLRERLIKQMRDIVPRGDLGALLNLVDEPRRLDRDQQEFMAARLLYINILREIAASESRLSDREGVVRSMGKPMAASISSFLAILMVCAAVLRALWQGLVR